MGGDFILIIHHLPFLNNIPLESGHVVGGELETVAPRTPVQILLPYDHRQNLAKKIDSM